MLKLIEWLKLVKFFRWFEKNILKIGVGFLLVFIPLYPKIPLIDVPHTWVYIRLEDIFIALIVLIWFIQLLQRKVSLKTPVTLPIFLYWLAGGISLLFSLVFLAPHLANFFPNVAIFHYLRRIEYMVLFFVATATIKSLKDVRDYVIIISLTVLGVILYGFGQRILGFPAFLTMNEEFAKGIPLYLPSNARVTSTFAGHYDLAAYLVLMIALLGSLVFGVRKALVKIGLTLLTILAFILLLLTASRVSFVVYLLTITMMLWWQKKKWLIVPVVIASFLLMTFVSGASERFLKTFRVRQVVYSTQTGQPIATLEKLPPGTTIPEEEELKEALPVGSEFVGLPTVAAPAEATTVAVIKKALPSELKTSTASSEIATISGSFLIQKALVYDISFTTRFQGEWPRAWKAFKNNPLLGTGYSSIALATDNDYLRILGETGILGFVTFFFLFLTLAIFIKFAFPKVTSKLGKSLVVGVAAGLFALFLNAILIDVFEASKVAFILWLLLGIMVGLLKLYQKEKIPFGEELKKVILSPLTFLFFLFILTFIVFRMSLKNYFVADDFTWLRWAASSIFKDLPSYFLSAQGFFYRPLGKIFYFLAYNIFWLRPEWYHFFGLLIHFGTAAAAFFLTSKILGKKWLGAISSLLFLLLPSHSESVMWISASTEIFSSFFLLWGLYFYLSKRYWLSFLSFPLALISYEGAIIFPLLIFLYDFCFKEKKKLIYLPFLILVPFYLWVRMKAGAHGLSGDYSYNFAYLIFNVPGNFLGYLGGFIAGSNFLPLYDSLRVFMRLHKTLAAILVGTVIFLSAVGGWFFKERLKISPLIIFGLGFIFIALLPFLGLGNMAERYGYLASFGFVFLLTLLIDWIFRRIKAVNLIAATFVSVFFIVTILGFYYQDLRKANRDWEKAGKITYQTLLSLRQNFLPLPPQSIFYFVNVPLRQGTAWIFPVGLSDGIWHTFRDETLQVWQIKSLEEAQGARGDNKNAHIFIFEDTNLKKVP